MGGPGAWRRIGPANEIVNFLNRFRPVDEHIFFAAPAFIGLFGMVLLDARGLAIAHQINGFKHGFDAHGEQAFEVDGPERIVGADLNRFLHQNGALIQPLIGPEDRKPGFLAPHDDRPVDGAGPAMQGQ